MSYLPISFLIVLCSLNTRGPRAILSSDSYPLDHRASCWHSLCASRFFVTALNRLWALRSSDFALHRFIHTFWSPICCATPFWPHPIAATSSPLLSLPFPSSHIASNTFPSLCHLSYTMSDPSFALPSVSPLNNRNYPSWSKEIKAWLRLKGLWLLVSGDETAPVGTKEKPADPREVAEWKRNAQKAAGALLLSVEEQFRGVLDGIEDDPIAIWTKLEEQFNKKSAGSRFNAMEDLFSIKKRNDESLQSLIHRVDESMRVLKNLRDSGFDLKKQDEELTCMALLWSLPSEFDTFRSSLSLMDVLSRSKLEDAFRREDLNRARRSVPTDSAQALVASFPSSSTSSSTSYRRSRPPRKQYKCDFCGATGHTDDRCFKRINEELKKSKPQQAHSVQAPEASGPM
ncbi:hypothetical protein HETIRDRAFT_311817, partial [Heterobasidion irregulare TC 32-1]